MASVRTLKKDIDQIMSFALSDCFYVLEYNTKINEKAIYDIAAEIVKAHRDLRIRAVHPDAKENPKQVKKFYQKLVSDMLKAADTALEKLSKEVKKAVETTEAEA